MSRALILCICLTFTSCVVDPGNYLPQNPDEVARVQRDIKPVVRSVPGADRAMLWTAARGHMDRLFAAEAIRLVDEAKQVVETHVIERVEAGMPWRTVVTVQVADDPALPGGARLGVVAQRIDARVDYSSAEDNRPVPTVWVLIGNDDSSAGVIADDILQRYLLLRQGRDPEQELPKVPRLGERASGERINGG